MTETHNEDNKSCLQNRCGEWAKCNNYACEGEHTCTCTTENEMEYIEGEVEKLTEAELDLIP
jgi:hypothetical protein